MQDLVYTMTAEQFNARQQKLADIAAAWDAEAAKIEGAINVLVKRIDQAAALDVVFRRKAIDSARDEIKYLIPYLTNARARAQHARMVAETEAYAFAAANGATVR
jgi:hypothetical protein